MFNIFVALPDIYIELVHIIKTYSSFWINDIYGIYIEFVILPPISKKSSGLVALVVQIQCKNVEKFQVFFSTELGYHNLSAMSCGVDISFRSKT